MKYRCTICGYVYDDAEEGVAFADLPDSWQCPLCRAPKSAFELIEEAPAAEQRPAAPEVPESIAMPAPAQGDEALQKLSPGQMAALCSNLARGCEKQYMPNEMALFNELADWFTRYAPKVEDATVQAVAARLQEDSAAYPELAATCAGQADRGALRVCSWGERATLMLSVLMNRYKSEGEDLLYGTEIWVCTVCGFVYIGSAAPETCPMCGVPSWKFDKIERRK